MDTINTHAKFLKHLDASRETVWRVARWLVGRGYNVTVPSSSQAATHAEWREHADQGDLYVSHRVEVKHLTYEFTGRKDWPHGPDFIVCAKHAYDRAKPKPYAYVILSASGRHGALVYAKDRPHWTSGPRTDQRYRLAQECYFCPLDKVQFFPMPNTTNHENEETQNATAAEAEERRQVAAGTDRP